MGQSKCRIQAKSCETAGAIRRNKTTKLNTQNHGKARYLRTKLGIRSEKMVAAHGKPNKAIIQKKCSWHPQLVQFSRDFVSYSIRKRRRQGGDRVGEKKKDGKPMVPPA